MYGSPSLFVPVIRICSIVHVCFEPDQGQILQQGEYNSLNRDMMAGFGHWEFDPIDLDNPFPNGGAHLWQGAEDSARHHAAIPEPEAPMNSVS